MEDNMAFDKDVLQVESMIGFCGTVPGGLKVHPDQNHLVYPVGCTLIVQNLQTLKQEALQGHTDIITCVAVSKSGKFLASGQATHMGFKADIIVWDYHKRELYTRFCLHQVKVASVAFSPHEHYLASLGGSDDGSLVIWDLKKKVAICGSPAQVMSAGETLTALFSNNDDNTIVTGGMDTLRVWQLDVAQRKVWPTEVNVGNLKRTTKCVEFAENDDFFFCGTSSGDILGVNKNSCNFQIHGPEKDKFSLGVTALTLLKSGQLLVGAGDGTVAIVGSPQQKFKRTSKTAKVKGGITSLALRGNGQQFYVGTEGCDIYRFSFSEFKPELISTCHYAPIMDACFAKYSARLFVTCSKQDIRVWDLEKLQELRRFTVPNMTCNCVAISDDGKTIVSGWDDGRIRAYYPVSGKIKYTIHDAHGLGVSALAIFSDGLHIISGGKEGSVRTWYIKECFMPKGNVENVPEQGVTFKEHKAEVTAIAIRKTNEECVSSSSDGTCIVWDLKKNKRRQMIRVNTLFKDVCYHPEEYQFITTGTDRKVGYWETYDGQAIRSLEGSVGGSINSMDIAPDGDVFVSAGDDKIVKVWSYQEGTVRSIGLGHGAAISRVKISPDRLSIVSTSADGAIIKWRLPHAVANGAAQHHQQEEDTGDEQC